jgi:DNA modification methylase
MKDYGVVGQVGYGQKYGDYLDDLKKIFSQIYDFTKEDGTLWIIIDTFKRNNAVVTLPFDLVTRLKETGWLLQEIIIWKKDKTVPWSSNGFM